MTLTASQSQSAVNFRGEERNPVSRRKKPPGASPRAWGHPPIDNGSDDTHGASGPADNEFLGMRGRNPVSSEESGTENRRKIPTHPPIDIGSDDTSGGFQVFAGAWVQFLAADSDQSMLRARKAFLFQVGSGLPAMPARSKASWPVEKSRFVSRWWFIPYRSGRDWRIQGVVGGGIERCGRIGGGRGRKLGVRIRTAPRRNPWGSHQTSGASRPVNSRFWPFSGP